MVKVTGTIWNQIENKFIILYYFDYITETITAPDLHEKESGCKNYIIYMESIIPKIHFRLENKDRGETLQKWELGALPTKKERICYQKNQNQL